MSQSLSKLILIQSIEGVFSQNEADKEIDISVIADMMNTNPVRPVNTFSASQCIEILKDILSEATEKKDPENEDRSLTINHTSGDEKFSTSVGKSELDNLVMKLYKDYRRGVAQEIKEYEETYVKYVEEIKFIENGDMDDEIQKQIDEKNKQTIYDSESEIEQATSELEESVSQPTSEQEHEQEHEHEQEQEQEHEHEQSSKKFHSLSASLLSNISSCKSASLFLSPIKSGNTNYSDLIYSQTDIPTIKAQCREGIIVNEKQLEHEIYKMLANSVMYNEWNSDVAILIREMITDVNELMKLFKE